jgi:hypothetical protein
MEGQTEDIHPKKQLQPYLGVKIYFQVELSDPEDNFINQFQPEFTAKLNCGPKCIYKGIKMTFVPFW